MDRRNPPHTVLFISVVVERLINNWGLLVCSLPLTQGLVPDASWQWEGSCVQTSADKEPRSQKQRLKQKSHVIQSNFKYMASIAEPFPVNTGQGVKARKRRKNRWIQCTASSWVQVVCIGFLDVVPLQCCYMQAGNDPSVWVNGLSNPSSVSSCLSAGGRWDRLQPWSGKSGKCWTENGCAGHVSSFIDIIFRVRDVTSFRNLWLFDRRPASVDLFLDLIVFDPQHSKNCWCFHFEAYLISP